MISFVSLFLGLVVGTQMVEVQVTEPVSVVEILLDGDRVGTIDGPPWSLACDLGEELAPHELLAVGLDRQGNELVGVRQWLNLPRQPAEVSIVLQGDIDGQPSAASVSWESLAGVEPSTVRAWMDGRPLEVQDPRSIVLPANDPDQLHFLRVELDFGGLVSSSAEVTFGGGYLDRVSTVLTALPLLVEGRKRLPPVAEIQGWFSHRGQPLRVTASETGPTELIVVRDGSAWADLKRIRSMAKTDIYSRQTWLDPGSRSWKEWNFQFLWPVSRRTLGAGGPYDLFLHSQKIPGESGSLHGLVTTIEAPLDEPQRLADAVAVAGVTAAGSNRRRAVLLVLGAAADDGSGLAASQARGFLDKLQVPLVVWATHAEPSPQSMAWGGAVDVSTAARMQRATRALFRQLDKQHLVWLEGAYLLHEIKLEATPTGVKLLGGGAGLS